jgi:2-dehydro-3-deoxyglucarate aldolase
MGRTRQLLRDGKPALGGWIQIGHPAVAELMAGEGFDWLCVDLEHTEIDAECLRNLALAVRGSPCDLLVRLSSCGPVQAKQALDLGADGIIVPAVSTAQEARRAVEMVNFPPAGRRGASFARATDYGRNFGPYFRAHNERVIVVVMIETAEGAANAEAILATPGIHAAFIGPYDLSASLGHAGELEHPDVRAARGRILAACRERGIPPGIHVVPPDAGAVRACIAEGYRFIACSVDTQLVLHGCREMLRGIGPRP